ncbi:hypothetical protein DICPUDRAFT_153030 [Dictyostelium purpureum]|uniref:Uncharacterized protein n=1 Tax=Dictyostelium purpureum TaxID=5786 RepID=F0ZMW5_DICPU|nr:uncharacterized protein DICPUDRAFT_153030 [Dictyostelium purpureum]EGC34713.1 hypothetical protein DICPUDRAFT_153030 [Dictyostelium purpureum]|eukprot:XP_003288754.1 hypothetical protein DICPUDRAFT_153030 [Dictyostelium purpureum]
MLDMGNERLSRHEDNLVTDLMEIVQKLMKENEINSRVIKEINNELAIGKNTTEELKKVNVLLKTMCDLQESRDKPKGESVEDSKPARKN